MFNKSKSKLEMFIVMITMFLAIFTESFKLFLPKNVFRQKIIHAVKKNFQSSSFDVRNIKNNSIIEYISSKGSKRLAIVGKRSGAHFDVLNEAKKSFSVPLHRISYHINGNFAFGDLLRLNELIIELKPQMVERCWEATYGSTSPQYFTSLDAVGERSVNLSSISSIVYGNDNPVRIYTSYRLMSLFGSVFFNRYMLYFYYNCKYYYLLLSLLFIMLLPLPPSSL